MKILVVVLFINFFLTIPAQALFLIQNNDLRRPGKSVLSAAQVAGGTAVNISWGVWEYSNLYIVFGTGAGLAWKQRLLQETNYFPFSWDISAETTSLRGRHTTAYGSSLWKRINPDLALFVKYEQIDSLDKWPGLPHLGYNNITSGGFAWRIWQNSTIVLQGIGNPDPFATFGFHILL